MTIKKIQELKFLLLETTGIDMLGITAAKLNCNILDLQLDIKNYKFVREERSGAGNGGGSLLYYKECLDVNSNLELLSQRTTTLELL